MSQKLWDNKLGVWPRITYACSRNDLIENLIRLIIFSRFYIDKNLENPNIFPTLQVCYEKQV